MARALLSRAFLRVKVSTPRGQGGGASAPQLLFYSPWTPIYLHDFFCLPEGSLKRLLLSSIASRGGESHPTSLRTALFYSPWTPICLHDCLCLRKGSNRGGAGGQGLASSFFQPKAVSAAGHCTPLRGLIKKAPPPTGSPPPHPLQTLYPQTDRRVQRPSRRQSVTTFPFVFFCP